MPEHPYSQLFNFVLLGAYPYLAILRKCEIPVEPLPTVACLSFSRDKMIILLYKELLKNKKLITRTKPNMTENMQLP